MAVAKRKVEKTPVLSKNDIDTAQRVVAFAREKEIDGVAQLEMYLVVAQRQIGGESTTLADFTKMTLMPFSTASRVAWDLVQKGLLRYENHATDRRKKLLVAIIP